MVFFAPPEPDPPEILFRRVWSAALPRASPFTLDRQILVTESRDFYAFPRTGDAWNVGAVDARTGHPLWNETLPASGELRLVAGGGHLLVAGSEDVWQIDPRNGRVVWHIPTSDEGVGPFVVGDRLVAETRWGRLQAIDLQTHRAQWTLQYPVEIGGGDRRALSCVSEGALWAAASDGDLIRVSLADGRLAFARPFTGSTLRQIVPMRGSVALLSDRGSEAWRTTDGTMLWRMPGRFPGLPFYASTVDEL